MPKVMKTLELVEEYLRRYGQLEVFRRSRGEVTKEPRTDTDTASKVDTATVKEKRRRKLKIPLMKIKSEDVVVTESAIKVPLSVKRLL